MSRHIRFRCPELTPLAHNSDRTVASTMVEDYITEYHHRPHSGLQYRTRRGRPDLANTQQFSDLKPTTKPGSTSAGD